VVDNGVFGNRANPRAYLVGPPFQVGQYRTGRGFVPAAGGNLADDPRVVPVLRRVGPGGNLQPVGAVLPDGDGCRPAFLLGVDPLGQPLPFADDDLRPGRQWTGRGLLNTLPMIRLSPSRRLGCQTTTLEYSDFCHQHQAGNCPQMTKSEFDTRTLHCKF
jgi:hypothetical protein